MNSFRYIKQNYDKFTKQEKLIADYLLSNDEKIINMSAKEIAEFTNTSAPTVVRFSKKLGYSSLNEMKLDLSLAIRDIKTNKRFEYLDSSLSTSSIINSIKDSFIRVIDRTISLIKEEELDKAIDLLIKADKIYIFGIGSSSLVGADLYYKLSRIGKTCIFHSTDSHLQVTSSVLTKKDDVVIAISYSGRTKEIIFCVENAKANNSTVISITKASVDNKLENLSDITLKVPFIEKGLREGAVSSRISQLAIIDMLFIGMARDNLRDIEDKLIMTKNAVEKLK